MRGKNWITIPPPPIFWHLFWSNHTIFMSTDGREIKSFENLPFSMYLLRNPEMRHFSSKLVSSSSLLQSTGQMMRSRISCIKKTTESWNLCKCVCRFTAVMSCHIHTCGNTAQVQGKKKGMVSGLSVTKSKTCVSLSPFRSCLICFLDLEMTEERHN